MAGFIYILTSKPYGTLYIGVTSDLHQRVHQHRTTQHKGFAAKYSITRLVYYERHKNMHEAIKREKAIKKWHRAWKLELIESVILEWIDLFAARNEQSASVRRSPLPRG